jgi:hypothetical protein
VKYITDYDFEWTTQSVVSITAGDVTKRKAVACSGGMIDVAGVPTWKCLAAGEKNDYLA